MAGPCRIRVVVSDATVLINLAHIDRIDLLGKLPAYEFVVPDHVVAEITDETQRERLRKAVTAGFIRTEAMTDAAELASYAELRKELGKGEAACLAMAEKRDWFIACDERRRFLRRVKERLGENRLINTPGILLEAIRANLLTVAEADAAKTVLVNHRFKMKFGSFAELLDR